MIKKILNVWHYNFNFYENRKLPAFYSGILYKHNNKDVVFKQFERIDVPAEKKLYRVYNIPPYLELILENPDAYRKIEFPEIDKGLLVDISKFNTIEDYAKQQFSSRKRKQIRSVLKRIDTCFNVGYTFYYGEIEKEKYDFLLNTAYKLIKRRFSQINKTHYHLSRWEIIKESTYKLILEKKASVFVIYDNDKPINVCFNYHFKKMTCNVLASYDIDYAKFSLGTIDLYKQLEWNIDNGFTIFDMSMGASEYKFKWSNNHYDLSHNIIIKKKSLISNLLGLLSYCYLKPKFYLFRSYYKNPNNKLLAILKNALQAPEQVIIDTPHKPVKYKLTTVDLFNLEQPGIEKINVETKTHAFLRKPFYDFLHANPELKNKVGVYKLKHEQNSYIIKGTNKTQKLVITN